MNWPEAIVISSMFCCSTLITFTICLTIIKVVKIKIDIDNKGV